MLVLDFRWGHRFFHEISFWKRTCDADNLEPGATVVVFSKCQLQKDASRLVVTVGSRTPLFLKVLSYSDSRPFSNIAAQAIWDTEKMRMLCGMLTNLHSKWPRNVGCELRPSHFWCTMTNMLLSLQLIPPPKKRIFGSSFQTWRYKRNT